MKFVLIFVNIQGLEAKKYRNTIDCAVQIWKKEGFFAYV
jgi:solute carrier family 25 citrate transporter 1